MRKDSLIFFFLFFLVSLILTLYIVNYSNFWFTNTDWLYGYGDLTNAQLSWQYFKDDHWRFPIGLNPNYGLEIANSIVFTDNIPLFAIFFKIINPILPEQFQYFSLWIFICFFLQFFFSYKLLLKFTGNSFFSFLSSFLFILCPFLLFRMVHHFSLGAHWIILYTFFTGYCLEEKKKTFHWIILISLSLLTHLYFTVMIFIIYFFFELESFLKKKNFKIILNIIYKVLYTLVLMYIIGYFESSPMNSVSSGYGEYKLDLLSIFDPKISNSDSWSYFLADLPGTHLEGFSYIGLGNIFLIFIFFIIFFFKNKPTFVKNSPFVFLKVSNIYLIVFLLWSLTTSVTILGNEIISIEVPKYIFGLLSIFSATGRFIWPLIYFFLILFLVFIFRNNKEKISFLIILLLLSFQFFDVLKGIKKNSFKESQKLDYDPVWNLIEKDYSAIRTTYLFNNYGQIFIKFSKILGNLENLKTDIMLNASLDREKAAQVRYDLVNKIKENKLDNKTAYIIDNEGHLLQLLKTFQNQNIGFINRDDFWIMLPNKKSEMNLNDIKKVENLKVRQILLDKKYDINFKDQILGFGWTHNFRKKGSWTEGENSFLLFKTPNSQKNLKIIFEISPYKSNTKKNFELQIYLDSELMKSVKLNKNKNLQNIEIELDNRFINKELVINFRLKNVISPYDIFESPDARKLGVLLNSILIKESQ